MKRGLIASRYLIVAIQRLLGIGQIPKRVLPKLECDEGQHRDDAKANCERAQDDCWL
jgi:hypothetical protein